MTISVWRIATDTRNYTADDLGGKGAAATGGRWNDNGLPMIYASETRALACLETLVHLKAASLPLNRYLVRIDVPDSVWAAAQHETAASLPIGWEAEPAGAISVLFGTKWANAGTSCLLILASVIVPEERNVLISPRHPDARKLIAVKIRRWLYDPRLGG